MLPFHLREQGVHVQEGFPCFLTTAHSDADFDFIREAFHNSLKAMRAGQALPQPTGVPSTLEESAAFEPVPLEAVARTIPITEPQREILLGTQLGDDANCAFNESTSLTLKGKLNEAALINSLEQLIQRHDGLRLSFDLETEAAWIAPSMTLPLTRH